MNDTQRISPGGRSAPRAFVGLALGFAGATLIWLLAPTVNYVIGASKCDLAGSYLPAGAIMLLLLMVLVVNPLLRLIGPRLALTSRQLATMTGCWLVASMLPGFGLLGVLPYSLAKLPTAVNVNRPLAETYRQMNLPPSLFPDKVGYGLPTRNCEAFLTQLGENQPMPWSTWVGPLLTWGALLLFIWLMMTGLAMILLPQWRRSERLTFPLLLIEQTLIQTPTQRRLLPPIFYSTGFWIALLAVFVVHLLSGLSLYHPGRVPKIPLDWDLRPFFREGMWSHLPWDVVQNRLYFVFVGIAFFVPTRIAVSIWFFSLAHGLYRVIGVEYFPPHHNRTVIDFRLGAALAMSAVILWLGRGRWKAIFVGMFRKARSGADRRDRISGWVFLTGLAGMWSWLVWVGVGWGWALALVGWGFMVTLLIARIVCEAGIPVIRIHLGKELTLLKFFPTAVVGPVTVFFGYIFILLFNFGSRMGLTPLAMHAVALQEGESSQGGPGDEAARSDRIAGGQWRFAGALVAVVLVGLVICGGAHLWASYHHSTSLDGSVQPLNSFGVTAMDPVQTDLAEWKAGQFSRPTEYNQVGHIAFGAALAGLLYILCINFPTWPIHPIGMLTMETSYGQFAWASIFIGWALKVAIVKFGGARLYNRLRPVFLGLIVGEIVAALFWTVTSALLAAGGQLYVAVPTAP
ncbi:MAG: hypothetical protein BIFFINMI_00712 [Phycisphaerae bacterium]|nr:hypothetical protein [Phycisphaerae bacterium]